jgi:DNA-binding PadR family transcriptional regulator
MSTRLVILGLLRDRPLHGYEIKHIIEEHMGDWTDIAFGSIYFALGKLAEEGFIEKIATEQEGHRPSRTIYQITPTGRDEFERLLREVWQNLERHYFTLDIGLMFIEALPLEEVKGYLRGRVAQLEAIVGHLDTHQAEVMTKEETFREMIAAIFTHSRVHFEAELTWTRELLKKVERRAYP